MKTRPGKIDLRLAVICLLMLQLRAAVASAGWLQAAKQATTTAAPSPSAAPPYRLAQGDVIEIKFFYNAELNDTIQIRPDGRISLPLIGEFEARNRTVAETAKELETLYAKHLKTPSITIQIRSYASQKVYVGGEVIRPGVVNLTGQLTILEAIMETGGARRTGNDSSVVLIRKAEDGQPQMRRILLKGEHGAPSAAAGMLLQPFDVILVPETGIAKLDRWVDQYVRQLVPVVITGGFSYLANATTLIR